MGADGPSRAADTKHIDHILLPWRDLIGRDFTGYRNHAARMATFTLMLKPCDEEEQRKIEIAACFHDIGIWTASTLDYLLPSAVAARDYLEREGLQRWTSEIDVMIVEHHRIREIRDSSSPLVEVFRRGDLVDFSRGIVRHGLPRADVADVMGTFPNAGFHRMLVQHTAKWVVRHPYNPLPMMRW